MDGSRIFCRILERKEPAHAIDEIDDLSVFPALGYHPLAVPTVRAPDTFGLEGTATGGKATIPAAGPPA